VFDLPAALQENHHIVKRDHPRSRLSACQGQLELRRVDPGGGIIRPRPGLHKLDQLELVPIKPDLSSGRHHAGRRLAHQLASANVEMHANSADAIERRRQVHRSSPLVACPSPGRIAGHPVVAAEQREPRFGRLP
jgi:hypothetical protein